MGPIWAIKIHRNPMDPNFDVAFRSREVAAWHPKFLNISDSISHDLYTQESL